MLHSALMPDVIRIRMAEGRSDFDACVEIQRAVWGLADLDITPALQLIATVHAGGMLHLADDAGGQVVGFAYAFAAFRDGACHIHSDMVAVLPAFQNHGIGFRLKWAQRETALSRGISLMTWTFDPMQARNAHLNLRRLGARAVEFYENFYGVTSSTLHHGLPTDRLLIRWALDDPRVEALSKGASPGEATLPAAPRINDVKWQAGWPISSDPRLDLDAPDVLLEIPPEWDVISRSAPNVAEGWHSKVRSAFEGYFAKGYAAVDLVPIEELGRRRPIYVLRRGA